MCRFIESIKLENGHFEGLPLHQARLLKAIMDYYPNEKAIDLQDFLTSTDFPKIGKYKCRVVFDSSIIQVEFTEYMQREIKSLQLVETDLESFAYKLEDRTALNEAYAKRGECDDVLLVRNGLLTDTSYTNIALFDGKNWFTPRKPLIEGVNRIELLQNGKIIEKDIFATELKNYKQICLFNAMIEFGELVLDVAKIQTETP